MIKSVYNRDTDTSRIIKETKDLSGLFRTDTFPIFGIVYTRAKL